MTGDAKQHPVQVGRVPARDGCGCYGLAPLTAQRFERDFYAGIQRRTLSFLKDALEALRG